MLETYSLICIPVAVGIAAEIVKFIHFSLKHGWSFNDSVLYGHMPSAHTAFVVSLVTTIGYFEGIHSAIFALSAAFAMIVIFDALRLRAYMGQHAQYINQIVSKLNLNANDFPRLKERVGHRPNEVAVGGVFELILTWIFISLINF